LNLFDEFLIGRRRSSKAAAVWMRHNVPQISVVKANFARPE
jgi:hypothetical protein